MDDILSQIIAYAPDKIDTELKAAALVQGSRNMDQEPRIPFGDGLSVDPERDSFKKISNVIGAYNRYRRGEKNPVLNFNQFFELFSTENFAEGGRSGYKYAGIVKQGPNKGKHKYTDFYPKKTNGSLHEWFDSKKEMNEALQQRKEASGRGLTEKELTKKYKKQIEQKGYKTWGEVPDNIKRSISTNVSSPYEKIGLSKIKNKTIELLENKKPINPKTGLPYTQEEFINLTQGQKQKLVLRMKDKKKPSTYDERLGYDYGKKDNKLLNYMKEAAKQQEKLPVKDRTFINVYEQDGKKYVGVRDVKAKTLYTHVDYDLSKKGAKKGTVITSHPQVENLESEFNVYRNAAEKFKYDSPDKLLKSYFSKYERVPTYNEIYNFFTMDRSAPASTMSKNNALTLQHLDVVAKNPTSNFQLLTGLKNTEANTIMNKLKRGEITEAKANYDLNKIGAGQEGYGVPKEKMTVGKGTGVAKREAVKLFKDAYKVNPKVVEDMTKKLLINLEARGCKGKAAGGRILFAEGTPGGKITECATKGIRAFIDDLKKGNYSKASLNILKGGGNILKNIVDPMELLKLRNLIGPGAMGLMAAFEAGVITDDVIRQGTPLNESLANNWLTKSFLPYTKNYAQAKNLLESGTVPSNMKKYVQDVVTFNDALMDIKGIENRKDSRLVDDSFGMIDGTSMYTKKQEQKDDAALMKKLGTLTEDVYTPGSAKALEMRSLQDEMEATRMAKKEFSPIFGFDKLKDRNLTSVFDSYISATEDAPKDFRPITYEDAEYEDKKLPLGLEQLYMNKLNLKPRDSLKNYFFKDGPKKKIVYGERKQDFAEKPISILEDLTNDYNKFERQKEASKYPGYYGANEKFMEGGIASLNVKK